MIYALAQLAVAGRGGGGCYWVPLQGDERARVPQSDRYLYNLLNPTIIATPTCENNLRQAGVTAGPRELDGGGCGGSVDYTMSPLRCVFSTAEKKK